jgi:cytochrome c oxidase subunit 1
MFGRMMNNKLGYLHFWTTFVSGFGVFFPQHFLGLAGVPRRYYSNSDFPMFDNLVEINEVVTFFAVCAALAQGVFMYNLIFSALKGQRATQNPWRSNTLEWTTPVEHIHGNWAGPIPEVHRWPYDYSKPGKEDDFIPQNVPLEPGEEDGGGGH